jgi:hypothetical protein
MLGFGGHFLTKSRRYSITFGHIRETRGQHAREAAREIDGIPEPDGETVIAIDHWRYAGTLEIAHISSAPGVFLRSAVGLGPPPDGGTADGC